MSGIIRELLYKRNIYYFLDFPVIAEKVFWKGGGD
jgi:hypothetical protein